MISRTTYLDIGIVNDGKLEGKGSSFRGVGQGSSGGQGTGPGPLNQGGRGFIIKRIRIWRYRIMIELLTISDQI